MDNILATSVDVSVDFKDKVTREDFFLLITPLADVISVDAEILDDDYRYALGDEYFDLKINFEPDTTLDPCHKKISGLVFRCKIMTDSPRGSLLDQMQKVCSDLFSLGRIDNQNDHFVITRHHYRK